MQLEGRNLAEQKLLEKIQNLDFVFQNSIVKIMANRNCEEIKLAGLTVGPFEEGNEYEVKYWVAEELAKSGIVFIKKGEMLDFQKLIQKHHFMLSKSSKEFVRLGEFFYPKVRRLLAQLEEKAHEDPIKLREFERAVNVVKDLIRCRRMKVFYRARDSTMTSEILEKMTPEERCFYEELKDKTEGFDKIMVHPNSKPHLKSNSEYLTVMTSFIANPIERPRTN